METTPPAFSYILPHCHRACVHRFTCLQFLNGPATEQALGLPTTGYSPRWQRRSQRCDMHCLHEENITAAAKHHRVFWIRDAKQGNAMQSTHKQSNAIQCNARQCNAMQCKAMQSKAKQSKATQSKAKQYNAKSSVPKKMSKQSKAKPSNA